MNSINILGNVGKEPELKVFGETTVCNFTVAVTRRFKRDVTDWFDCVVFGKQAETINQYVKKGDKIAVSGEIQFEQYNDKEGNRRTTTKLIVNNFDLIGKVQFGNQQGQTQQEPTFDNLANQYNATPVDFSSTINITDEDLPF